jgi:hypothetical protein
MEYLMREFLQPTPIFMVVDMYGSQRSNFFTCIVDYLLETANWTSSVSFARKNWGLQVFSLFSFFFDSLFLFTPIWFLVTYLFFSHFLFLIHIVLFLLILWFSFLVFLIPDLSSFVYPFSFIVPFPIFIFRISLFVVRLSSLVSAFNLVIKLNCLIRSNCAPDSKTEI